MGRIAAASCAQSSPLLTKTNVASLQIQALREQIGQLEEKRQRDLDCQKLEHRQEMEKYDAEQLALREELRKELAQVHIEKFSAMAAELSQLHNVRKTDACFLEVADQLYISNSFFFNLSLSCPLKKKP